MIAIGSQRGATGSAGTTGSAGSNGTNGTNGSTGATGSTGAQGIAGPGTPVMTANTTGTIAFNSSGNSETVYNTSGTLLASATITLPSASTVGQTLRYVSAAIITTLTVSGTISIGAAITTLAANGAVTYQAINTGGSFVRLP